MRYPSIVEERVGYTIKGQGPWYYIRGFVKYFPYTIASWGIILELGLLIYKRITKQSITPMVSYDENITIVFIWLLIGLAVNLVTTFTRIGFFFSLLVFNLLFTLGIYNVYLALTTSFSKREKEKILILGLAMIILTTQFLGITDLIDSLLKLDTSSPVLDKSSIYRGDASTEISDYYMLKYLLTTFPSSDFKNLYSDTKIINSIVSVASDLYPKHFPCKPMNISINPYALVTFLKSKNIKGILILSAYNMLTGRAIVPQGTVKIDLDSVLSHYNLVYDGVSCILISGS
jgi:hypothetical protein